MIVPVLIVAMMAGVDFRSEQMTHRRVRNAQAEKAAILTHLFRAAGVSYPPRRIFLRAFKREQLLELWAASGASTQYRLIKTYEFCASSGVVGPKREQGDGQIPEGFYHVDRFNPLSNYHLSLGLNYPNRADRLRGARDPGGDIFIHGGCATIGCIPITDDWIKEVYVAAVEARSAGQSRIPVHIYPARLDGEGMQKLRREFVGAPELIDFWERLKRAFDHFESGRRVPGFVIDASGRYLVRDF